MSFESAPRIRELPRQVLALLSGIEKHDFHEMRFVGRMSDSSTQVAGSWISNAA